MIQLISKLISFGSVLLLVATVALFMLAGAMRIGKLPKRLERVVVLVGKYSIWTVFLVSGGAIVGSLFYSEIAGFEPCTLCWYQRILLYPQALIAIFALYLRDRRFAPWYMLGLSYIGGVVALYHTYLQYGRSSLIPCSASVAAVSCAQRFVFEFGFLTIPMMSLAVFVFIILTIHVGLWYNQKNV